MPNRAAKAWSPDGTRIADTANDDISIIDIALGARQQLTTDPADELGPRWSPAAAAIAFVSSTEPARHLIAGTLDRSDQRLTPSDDDPGAPDQEQA